jgi:hypothetical protein
VVWSAKPQEGKRVFAGWAWEEAGPLPRVPWDLGKHGELELDLEGTLREALAASGL